MVEQRQLVERDCATYIGQWCGVLPGDCVRGAGKRDTVFGEKDYDIPVV